MDSDEIYSKFLEIEEEMQLLEKKIQDVYFWERIRSDVFREIKLEKEIINKPHEGPSSGITDQIGKIFMMFRNLFVKNPFLSKSTDLLFWGHSRRKKLEDAKWWDVYCDPVTQELDRDYVYVEAPYMSEHKKPAKTDNIRYLDSIIYSTALVEKLGFLNISLSSEDEEIIRNIEKTLESELSAEIDIRSKIKKNLSLRGFRLPIFRRLLKKISPEAAIITVSYGKETFIEACKERNIKVIELQHGVINKYHLGYSYPNAGKKRAFPDYLFTFGDFWHNIEYPIPEDNVISTGHPYFEQRKDKFEDVEEKNQILFISQGSVGEDLSKFAVELADSIDDYNIVYKLHPGEFSVWKERYPWLEDSSIEVVRDERPLYELFAESRIQVGVYSTAIYEGIGFDLKTFLVDLPGVESMEALLEQEYCTLVSSPKEIKLRRGDEIVNVNIEEFFKSESKKNSLTEIENIIDQ